MTDDLPFLTDHLSREDEEEVFFCFFGIRSFVGEEDKDQRKNASHKKRRKIVMSDEAESQPHENELKVRVCLSIRARIDCRYYLLLC
jgi:hypothetical protein